VLLAHGREAPFELTGLTVAPGQFPQVRQQDDGLVVPPTDTPAGLGGKVTVGAGKGQNV
jgi:hypothetical protein